MSVEYRGSSKTSAEQADEAHRHIRTPRIELEGAEAYYTPRELYAKRLINSPIEFGTKTIRRELPKEESEPGTIEGRVYEIDIAIHPHRGALVCGFASGGSGSGLEDRIVTAVERLEKERKVLVEACEESTWSGWAIPPVGIFVVAPDVDGTRLPAGWNEGRAWVCPDDGRERLRAEMMEAMKSVGGGYGIEDWQRFAAVVRTMGAYTSALEWLLEFEAI